MPRLSNNVDRLIDLGAELIAEANEFEVSRTERLIHLAKIIVHIRTRFEHNGYPDWAGRTAEYRHAIARMYAQAGIPPDSVSNIQSAVRYHIGNRLREVAPSVQLEAAGVTQASPRERQQARQTKPEPARATEPHEPRTPTETGIDLRDNAIESARNAARIVKSIRGKLPSDETQLGALRDELTALADINTGIIADIDKAMAPKGRKRMVAV